MPTNAIVFQSLVTLTFIVTASFETILVFAGFTLGVNTFFTVLGVFALRIRRPELNDPIGCPSSRCRRSSTSASPAGP